MLKRYIVFLSTLLSLSLTTSVTAGASKQDKEYNEKVKIMKEDQIDTTDLFAIPLDDSEVEDEEELAAIKVKEKKFEEKQAAQKK